MKNTKIISGLLILFISTISFEVFAQPPGGRMTPEEMTMREKQNLYKKITDLSEDQTMLVDGVYDEFGESLDELFKEGRETRDREAMRTKMEALRAEKDGLMKDILNDSQWAIYEEMNADQKKKMEERRAQRGERSNNPDEAPED